MEEEPQPAYPFIVWAAGLEGGLAVLAVLLGWLLGLKPLETLDFSMEAVGIGVTATFPLLAAFWVLVKYPVGPFRSTLRFLDEFLLPLFRQSSALELLIVSLLAGLGEEMLFRGIVQAGLTGWIGPPAGVWIALVVAAVVFGLLHAATPTYALLAAAIGLYLGGIWLLAGNLLTPICTHAVYDFLALVYLVKVRPIPSAA
jgi:membrane protease YdiL (CAAX protease family)